MNGTSGNVCPRCNTDLDSLPVDHPGVCPVCARINANLPSIVAETRDAIRAEFTAIYGSSKPRISDVPPAPFVPSADLLNFRLWQLSTADKIHMHALGISPR